jgi:hypothetical protein
VTRKTSDQAERAALKVVPGSATADDPEDAGGTLRVHGNPDAIRKIRRAVDAGMLPETFVQAGKPIVVERVSGTVIVLADEDATLPVQCTRLDGPNLARLLAEHITLESMTAKGWAEWMPSAGVLSAALSGASWSMPTLNGIVGIPVVRHDGTLLQRPGYDARTGLYLAPTVRIEPIAERPSAAAVQAARAFVFDRLLADFPWERPADRANYIALLVSPYLRYYLRCLAPLGIITASTPASGKTLLTGLVGLLAGQKSMTWPADNDEELRKTITAAFHEQAGVMLFDNLAEGTEIGSPILANLLTAEVWSDRLMGGNSKLLSFPNDRLWMVTGNNLLTGGDIRSRHVNVRLAPQDPNPEQRTGFTIDDLPTQILRKDFQATVLQHLLVLIVDWTAAGAPRTGHTMRQFSEWARGVGGFLEHHQVAGFLGNLDDARLNDAEDMRWSAFLTRWVELLGTEPVRASDLYESSVGVRDSTGHEHDRWDGDFITNDRGNRPRNPQVVAQLLTGHLERWHGDPPIRVVRVLDKHTKGWRYYVQRHGA